MGERMSDYYSSLRDQIVSLGDLADKEIADLREELAEAIDILKFCDPRDTSIELRNKRRAFLDRHGVQAPIELLDNLQPSEQWIDCLVSKGMFSDERVVTIGENSVFIDASHVRGEIDKIGKVRAFISCWEGKKWAKIPSVGYGYTIQIS